MLEENKKKQSIIKKNRLYSNCVSNNHSSGFGCEIIYNGCSSNNIFDIIYNYNSDIKYWNFFFD